MLRGGRLAEGAASSSYARLWLGPLASYACFPSAEVKEKPVASQKAVLLFQ